jgi:hypothetical protein
MVQLLNFAATPSTCLFALANKNRKSNIWYIRYIILNIWAKLDQA